jgi:murein DD-endopeptidase MepM/ murein hydrolase activator NlpD
MTSSPAQESVKPVRRRIEWWMYLAIILAIAQVAFLAIPQARLGLLGAVLWIFGLELVPLAAISLLAIGLLWSAFRRPFWTKRRVAWYLFLLVLWQSNLAFRIYPSSHDREPSQVAFRLPLDGLITVAWGGGTPALNYHVVAPDQRWAYDLLVTRDGKIHRGEGQDLTDHYIYGSPVLAPAPGVVQAAFDGDTDRPVGTMEGYKNVNGNYVVLRVAPNEYLFLCHLKPGSVQVKPGQEVVEGQELGRVGNSGHTSAPHLHIHLQDSPEDDLAEGIPLLFHHYKVGRQYVERGIPTGGGDDDRLLGQIVENVTPGSQATRGEPRSAP